MSKKCPNCGLRKISNSKIFCPKDGTRLVDEPTVQITVPAPETRLNMPSFDDNAKFPESRPTQPSFGTEPSVDDPWRMQQSSNNGFRYTVDPTGLTKFVKIMLGFYVSASVIMMIVHSIQLGLLASLSTLDDPESAFESNSIRFSLAGLYFLVIIIVTGISVLMWIYRANKNCRGFGASDMRFTPGWAVAYFFIPILSLFRPFQTMKEIWKVSSDPNQWQRQPGSPLIGWWWALWLISLGVWWISTRFALSGFFEASSFLGIFGALVDIALCLVLMRLVTEISNKQERLVRQKPRVEVWGASF